MNSMTAKAHLASTIRAVMRANLWTQADFARHAGIGEDVLSTWMTGRSYPRLTNLATAAKNIGMAVDDFLPPEDADELEALRAENAELKQKLAAVRALLTL